VHYPVDKKRHEVHSTIRCINNNASFGKMDFLYYFVQKNGCSIFFMRGGFLVYFFYFSVSSVKNQLSVSDGLVERFNFQISSAKWFNTWKHLLECI